MRKSILATLSTVLLLINIVNCWSTSTTEHCVTHTAARSATTKTVTTTRYVEFVSTVTSTPVRVLPISTTTSTVPGTYAVYTWNYTATTTVTDSLTEPVESYTYITTVSSSTTTRTLTSGMKTTTIPAPAGFTPIASLHAESTYAGAADVGLAKKAAKTQVICHKKYILETTTTSTVRASMAVTSTDSSSIVTVYSYHYHTYSETGISFTETSVISTTTTETETYTEVDHYTSTVLRTTTVPTATTYPACATNNVVNSFAPNEEVIGYGSSQTALQIAAPDPASCCAECFQLTNCTGMVYIEYLDDYDPPYTEESCFLFFVEIGAVCNASAPAGWVFETGENLGTTSMFVSNGPCGQGVWLYSGFP